MERNDILALLTRTKPASIMVRDAASEERALALRAGRTKWEHAATLLASLLAEPGAVAELRDRSGAVLQVVRAPKPSQGESLSQSELEPAHRALIAAQDHILDRFAAFSKTVIGALESALKASVERNQALEKRVEQMLGFVYKTTVDASQAVSDATLALAEREGEGEGRSPLEGIAAEYMRELKEAQAAKRVAAAPQKNGEA